MTNNEKKILEYLEMMPDDVQTEYVVFGAEIIEILRGKGIILPDNLGQDRSNYVH